MARSNEPFWWAPFMAGAGAAAFLMPVTILLTSVGVASDFIAEARLWQLLGNPWVRLYLFVLIFLSLFHAAHRLRFVLVDFGLKAAHNTIAILCYGTAVAGTALAVLLVFHLLG